MRIQVLPPLLVFLVSLSLSPGFAQETTIRLRIVDAETKRNLAARLYLQDEAGQAYFFSVDDADGSAVRYEKQNWINNDSVEYHTTVSAHPCSTSVPPGRYQLTVEHGKTHFPSVRTVEVGDESVRLTVPLQRWCDPAAQGWFSGDTHLHRPVEELKNVVLAEDLNVALPLTNWVTIAGRAPTAGNKNQADIPSGLVQVDSQHVIWPRNTEYEISRVDQQRHTLGALFVLGHRDGLELGVPPWKPVIESAAESNRQVLFDMDKLDWPFAMLLPTITPHALYEVANNHMWRTEFAFEKWNTRAPPYMQPPFGASSGGHRQWIDYTMEMYYTLLNCGLRLPSSAGTANGVHPVPAGFSRVYVHLPQGFSYDAWMQGLKEGRSFVTTGPMLYATADDADPGHVFRLPSGDEEPKPISISAELLSEQKIGYGELLVNGRPEQLLRPQNEKTSAGAFRTELQTSFIPQRSGWFAIRFWEPRPDGQSRFVHSAPWYVELDDEPVRPQVHEKRYLVDRMRQEIDRSKDVLPPAALQEYQRALAFYKALPVQDDADIVPAVSRPAQGEALRRWLDNMIHDHQFTAEEVRRVTGLSLAEAEREVAARADDEAAPEVSLSPAGQVRILPYPGGRHPRRGFLDGAIRPQRDTKVSIFPPWENGGYVVVDVPEAIFSNLGLTYLAHTHIPTIWDEQGVTLPQLEWSGDADELTFRRRLPNGISFSATVNRQADGAAMQLQLTNGTEMPLSGLRVQVCNMLKGMVGFNLQEPLTQVTEKPFVAVRAEDADRWIISAWQPCQRVWTNPPVPCVHSDPIFPDCQPGETVTVRGGLWFYQGDDVQEEIDRLAAELGS